MTRHRTPCSRNHARVLAASGRTDSAHTTSATGIARESIVASAEVLAGLCAVSCRAFAAPLSGIPDALSAATQANSSTREPVRACASIAVRTSGYSPSNARKITSGAPMYQRAAAPSEPVPRTSALLHLREDENGTREITRSRPPRPAPAVSLLTANACSWRPSASVNSYAASDRPASTAAPVMFGVGSSHTSRKASSTSCAAGAGVVAESGSSRTPVSSMPPSVIVPVLSRLRQSTRARVSTASSSCTRVLRRAKRIAAMAKFSDVSSTSPSGIMPTTPATAETTASRHCPVAIAAFHPPTRFIWESTSSTHNGTTRNVMNLRIVLMPSCKSDFVRVNTLACAVRRAA